VIGQIFKAEIDEEGHAEIIINGGEFSIFNGEYEIVEEGNN